MESKHGDSETRTTSSLLRVRSSAAEGGGVEDPQCPSHTRQWDPIRSLSGTLHAARFFIV